MFNFKKKQEVDYEQLWHDSQEKLSWYMNALETKQIEYGKIEDVALTLKQDNEKLRQELEALKQNMLDLPKMLGKNLGK